MNRATFTVLALRLSALLACGPVEGTREPGAPVRPPPLERGRAAEAAPTTTLPARPPEPPVFAEEGEAQLFLHCTTDAECEVVRNGCCQSNSPRTAIRADMQSEFAQRFDCVGARCRTYAVIGGPPLSARCEQGLCRLAYGEWDGKNDEF